MKPMQLELRKVEKRFGKVCALRPLDLTLPAGAKIGLIGPNGSGKTTLIRVLLGLVRHEGELWVDGAAVRREEFARRVAYVPQLAPQLAATCRELVRTVAALRGHGEEVVAEVAAELALPFGAVADRPFRSLSGGSKQKLLIALALAARPDLLILDEPTASLDAEARGRFFALQRGWAGQATLILCSHRLEEIRSLVDHVVALHEGALAYQGEASEVLAQRVGSVLELKVAGAAPWLSANGFAPGANGWWSRSVDRAAKLALLPEALRALGAELLDVAVRDLDLVELRGEGRHA